MPAGFKLSPIDFDKDVDAHMAAVTATGTLNPVSSVQVGTYVSGPIQAIHVDYNTPVRKGQLLARIDPWTAHALATQQYDNAPSMTDRLAALGVLVRGDAAQAHPALLHFRERYADNPLAMDKWFAVQTQLPGDRVLARVRALADDDAFTMKNPNRVNALFGSWARGNPDGFHRADGSGYQLLAERLGQLDALNPQIAARLATAFNGWQRLEPGRRAAARAAIESLAARAGLSRNLTEIVQSMLHG